MFSMRSTIPPVALALALATGTAGLASAQGRMSIETYTLPNGLKVVLAEDHSAQVVAVDMWYNVGGRNEQKGRTGFAHLFEHMMFQGSANVKKGEHMQLVERAGGNMNGSTWDDRTNYYQVMPSNRLNLGLWLEADRLRSLAVTDSTLNNQREAVKEERRLRVDNQPYAGALQRGLTLPFDSTTCFAYAHELIGSMDDLNAATTADVHAFFKLYYAPNNATLTVVGDFQPPEAKALIEQYFGGIPRGETPPAVRCDQRMNTGTVRRRVPDAKANLPAVFQLYRIPEYQSDDMPAIELLATILGQGESSRLNRVLARDTKAAVAAQALANPSGGHRGGPGIFFALAIANQGVTADSIDVLLAAQIARLSAEGVTEAELTKAKNSYRASTINERQRALDVAEALQRANLYFGDPNVINSDLDRYMKVTVEDIRRVARAYLVPDNAVVLLVVPGGATQ
jgi:predicted Zn-dependent peptidase